MLPLWPAEAENRPTLSSSVARAGPREPQWSLVFLWKGLSILLQTTNKHYFYTKLLHKNTQLQLNFHTQSIAPVVPLVNFVFSFAINFDGIPNNSLL